MITVNNVVFSHKCMVGYVPICIILLTSVVVCWHGTTDAIHDCQAMKLVSEICFGNIATRPEETEGSGQRKCHSVLITV
jgi:hypothetical protein